MVNTISAMPAATPSSHDQFLVFVAAICAPVGVFVAILTLLNDNFGLGVFSIGLLTVVAGALLRTGFAAIPQRTVLGTSLLVVGTAVAVVGLVVLAVAALDAETDVESGGVPDSAPLPTATATATATASPEPTLMLSPTDDADAAGSHRIRDSCVRGNLSGRNRILQRRRAAQ